MAEDGPKDISHINEFRELKQRRDEVRALFEAAFPGRTVNQVSQAEFKGAIEKALRRQKLKVVPPQKKTPPDSIA